VRQSAAPAIGSWGKSPRSLVRIANTLRIVRWLGRLRAGSAVFGADRHHLVLADRAFLTVAHALYSILADIGLGRQLAGNRVDVLRTAFGVPVQGQPHAVTHSELV